MTPYIGITCEKCGYAVEAPLSPRAVEVFNQILDDLAVGKIQRACPRCGYESPVYLRQPVAAGAQPL